MKRVVIIGAGLGGLALAARLQHDGCAVTVVEKNSVPGGRCGLLEAGGYRFDMGPTLLLMPDVVRRLFLDLGRNPDDYLDLRRLDPNYRLHFPDGTSFDFFSNRVRMFDVLEQIEPGAGKAFGQFLDDAGYCYRTARAKFVERNFLSAREFFTAENLGLLFRMRAHRTLYRRIAGWFRDERLRQAFSFQTMYLGLSPYESPALYSLLPFTEFEEGIWYPMGGMHELARSMARLVEEEGGTIRYDAPVKKIVTDGRHARGVLLEDGEIIDGDLVIANADLPYARSLVGARQRNWKFTSSGFLLHLGLERRYDHAPHHSVVFPRDYALNFREIFRDRTLPSDPAFYICRPTATDPSVAPEGCDVLYVLAPMPHLGAGGTPADQPAGGRRSSGIDWSAAAPKLREHFLDRLEALGFDGIRENIVVERTWTPVDFRDHFNLAAGCAFGLSHDMLQVGWFRPHNRDDDHENLYYVGASTHPGTGIPMVLFSAELVQQRIAEEWR
jgi:phytoene desaturase